MPDWITVTIQVAALLGAVGVIAKFGTVVYKGAKEGEKTYNVVKNFGEVAPTLKELTPALKELLLILNSNPNFFFQIGELTSQFKTDHGTSIKDQLNRHEKWLKSAEKTLAALKAEMSSARELAKSDREQLAKSIELLEEMIVKDRKVAIDLAKKDAVAK